MGFTVTDFRDLIRVLDAHPEWQGELRRLVLTDDLLALPGTVRELAAAERHTEQRLEELAAAQQRTEQRLEELTAAQQRTEQRLEELAAAQQRTEQRLEELAVAQQRTEQRLEELAAAQQRTEQRLEELAAAQQRTEQRLEELAAAQQRTEEEVRKLAQAQQSTERRVGTLTDDVGTIKEYVLESRYRDRAPAYFGSATFRGVRALPAHEVASLLEQGIERGELSWEERQDVLQADLVVRGQLLDRAAAYLVVGISWGVGTSDVERAARRASYLGKVVKRAVPAVAGHSIIPEAQTLAERLQVVQVTDGHTSWADSVLTPETPARRES